MFVCAAVIAGLFSGCAMSDKEQLSPSDFYIELKTDGELIYNKKGEFRLNLIHDSGIFGEEISSENVTVCYSRINSYRLTDVNAASGVLLNPDEYSLETVAKTEVTRNSDKSVTLRFVDDSFDYSRPERYIFMFDRTACATGKYMFASAEVKYPPISLISDTSQMIPGSRTRLLLTLDKSEFSEDMTSGDIMFGGGFSDAVISDFERVGDSTVAFSLKTGSAAGKTGYIIISSRAIADACSDVYASIRIAQPRVFFDTDRFDATQSYARLPLMLTDCAFSDAADASMFSCDNEAVTITRFERSSPTEGTLYISLRQNNVTGTVGAVSSSLFTVSPQALNINIPLDFKAVPEEPRIGAVITGASQADGAVVLTADFNIVNGSFNAVSKNNFSFGGDYSSAVVKSVTSADAKISVVFSVKTEKPVESAVLDGTVSFKSDSVTTRWRTNCAVPPFLLRYSADALFNGDGGQYEYENSAGLLSAVRAYARKVLRGEISPGDIMSVGDDLDELLRTVCASDDCFALIGAQCERMTENERFSGNAAEIYRDKLIIRGFSSDVQVLADIAAKLSEYFIGLTDIRQKIALADDAVTKQDLLNEQVRLVKQIETLCDTRIKGKTFTEFLLSVTDEYETKALAAFDSLSDSMHNWERQSREDKKKFRYCAESICALSSFAAFLSMDKTDDGGYDLLFRSVNTLCDFLNANRINDAASLSEAYCNTLGKMISLSAFEQDGGYEGSLSAAEIAQLENMLDSGVTLREELVSIGFDLNGVRYIVCSDTPAQTAYSSSDGMSDGAAVKSYAYTGKASVYDLSESMITENFEYADAVWRFAVTKNHAPQFSAVLYKKIQLYKLG